MKPSHVFFSLVSILSLSVPAFADRRDRDLGNAAHLAQTEAEQLVQVLVRERNPSTNLVFVTGFVAKEAHDLVLVADGSREPHLNSLSQEYRELVQAFRRLDDALRNERPSRRVDDQFRRLDYAIQDLRDLVVGGRGDDRGDGRGDDRGDGRDDGFGGDDRGGDDDFGGQGQDPDFGGQGGGQGGDPDFGGGQGQDPGDGGTVGGGLIGGGGGH